MGNIVKDFIDYGKLVDEAMHIIVYKVLKLVVERGLPGEHHFFISFLTHFPGVVIPQSLHNRYPREMTIVLQYQYQELIVDSKGFSVTLKFSGKPESIYVPYAAITTFADPSVQFGLQFRENEIDEQDELNSSYKHTTSDVQPSYMDALFDSAEKHSYTKTHKSTPLIAGKAVAASSDQEQKAECEVIDFKNAAKKVRKYK